MQHQGRFAVPNTVIEAKLREAHFVSQHGLIEAHALSGVRQPTVNGGMVEDGDVKKPRLRNPSTSRTMSSIL